MPDHDAGIGNEGIIVMLSLNWPKISLALVAVLLLGGAAAIFYLGATLSPPAQTVIQKELALPGAAAGGYTPSVSSLPDLPAPPPLPGAAP